MTSHELARYFAPVVRLRGAEYARRGAVSAERLRDGVLRVVVDGEGLHDVELEIVQGRLRGSCTCPYASRTGACKHLWATVVHAEGSGALARLALRADDGPAPSRERREHHPGWRELTEPVATPPRPPREEPRRKHDILYALDVPRMLEAGQIALQVLRRKTAGASEAPEPLRVPPDDFSSLPAPEDRALFSLLRELATEPAVAPWRSHRYHYQPRREPLPSSFDLPLETAPTIFSLAARAGRLRLIDRSGELAAEAISFDDGPAWELGIVVVEPEGGSGAFQMEGRLQRGGETLDLSAPLVLTASGWVVVGGRVGRFHHFGLFQLVARLRRDGRMSVPRRDGPALVVRLHSLPDPPPVALPPSLAFTRRAVAPMPALSLTVPRGSWRARSEPVLGRLSFSYEGEMVGVDDQRAMVVRLEQRELLPRDREGESRAALRLTELGFRPAAREHELQIAPPRVPEAVRALVADGWRVEADGRVYRRSGKFNLAVSSGVDWFDVTATLEFDDVPAPLPALLAAARGDGFVRLGDGSLGLLPEDWLARHGLLVKLGADGPDGVLRFRRSQTALLDLLVAAEPEAQIDEVFARARRELAGFDRIEPARPPRGFAGTLRPYQELGLGWMAFLRRFGFGGCLADDMGLGKTVQVLAMLASRRREGAKAPSLIVVPRSLVSNWQAEARRFAPRLRVLAHVDADRAGEAGPLREHDVVLTTYGILKNDAAMLAEVEFDYVILDEAQAIKNPDSFAAKAARRLRGGHRLALTGTPVENHLGELWSLFEFLEPGLVGRLGLATGGRDGRASPAELETLARGLRPFILRRTKAQVAPELPPKHEETLVCDMEAGQRRLYQELRDHYRAKVIAEVDRAGLSRARMHVLEALLRLRQAACHPGLVDRNRAGEPAAKLEVLVARLAEVVAEGHKALVFSQFTSLLALVKSRLDEAGITHEYLDGKTRDRAERVARFQGDVSCGVFLLSLKAGGVGLNLTAADYVFILDPWWNPAVEAQAVDRAHRIGQDKHVFAYRLLCRDTIEEKIAALQGSKRALADAIVTADEGFIRQLDRGTLESLLS